MFINTVTHVCGHLTQQRWWLVPPYHSHFAVNASTYTKLFSIFHPVRDISRNHTCYVKYEEDQILLIRPIILGPTIFTKLFSIFYPHFQESYRLCKIWRASNFVFTKLFLLPWNCNKLSYSRLVESSITLLLDRHTGIKTCFSFASFPIPEHEYTGRGRVSFNFLTWAKSA